MTDASKYGISSDADVPQGNWMNGRPESLGIKTAQPMTVSDMKNRDRGQKGSIESTYEGTGVERAFDPVTNRTILPHQLLTMNPEQRERIVLTISGRPQVSIAQARMMGWTPTKGPFADPVAAPELEQQDAESQQQPEPHPDLQMEAFDNGGEADLLHDEYVQLTSPGDQMRAIGEIVDKGQLSQSTFTKLASQMGVATQEEAEAKATQIVDAFGRQARAAMAEVAPFADPDEIAAWAWREHPSDFAAVQKKHATLRTTSGYKALAQKYLETLDVHSPDALLNAAYPNGGRAFKTSAGKIMLDVPGHGPMSWKVAVQAGFVGTPKENG